MINHTPTQRRLRSRRLRPETVLNSVPGPVELQRFDQPYHLTGDGYRVVLGCCNHSNAQTQLENGRSHPAKAATTIPKEEVKS
jgi:hypothetical protein